MAQKPLIFGKILDIQERIPAILKDRKFTQNGREVYRFRGIDDLYNALHPHLTKARVFMTPQVLERESTEKPTKTGSILFYEKLLVKYTLYAEDGSSVEATTVGIGMDSSDKAGNKAMSVAQKYALIQIFSIPTEEKKDPEEDGLEAADHNYDLDELQKKLNNCKNVDDLRDLFAVYDNDSRLKTLFSKRHTELKATHNE